MFVIFYTFYLCGESSPTRIPVWFIQVENANGGANFPDFDLNSILDQLNGYFDGVFEFSLCYSGIMKSDDFHILNVDTEFAALDMAAFSTSGLEPKNCVKVFMVNQIINNQNEYFSGYGTNRVDFKEKAAVYRLKQLSNPNDRADGDP